MGFKLNPFTGKLDEVGADGGGGAPGGSDTQVQFNDGGAFAGVANSSVDNATGDITLGSRFISILNGAASAPPGTFTGTWFTGGTATTTKPQVVIEPTGTTSTGWSPSGTGFGVNAASGFAGNLLDLQVNGTSRARFTSAGLLRFAAPGVYDQLIAFGGGYLRNDGVCAANTFTIEEGNGFQIASSGVKLSNTSSLGWASGNPLNTGLDVLLFRDAADTLAQRRTTNAQTFRCYGTYTNASNYVRASLSSTSTAVTLAAETAGTGADDIPLNLTAAGTGAVKVNSNLEIADTKNIALDTGTGTKIGTATTQKLGFWDKAPVVQPTTGISGATFVADSGGNIHPTSTFDGYTIAQVVAALRQLGILA
jgi:hypothetical protein